MRLALAFLFVATAFAQTANYPGSYDTNASLFVTADNVQTTLANAMQAGDTAAVFSSCSAPLPTNCGFAANMIVTICNSTVTSGPIKGKCTSWEHMQVTNVAGNVLTVTRGIAGTSAVSHASGSLLSGLIDHAHQSVLADAIKKIETAIGLNPITTGSSPVVPVPTATGIPLTLGGYVDGSAASPQASNANSSVVFQRANGLPNNIATAFTFDCFSTAAAGANLGCITTNSVIHDSGRARGGTATRSTVYADQPVSSAALSTATVSSGTVTVTTGSAIAATVGSPVIIAGTSGMTNLNGTYDVASIVDSTHFTFSCGGCSGGPGSGGTVSVPVGYFASWQSVWKQTGPNIRVVGRESDMNNTYGDAGDNVTAQDATFNDALYCSLHNCTVGIYIDSGDGGTSKYYHPLQFGSNAVMPNYPYIDTSANNGVYAADFAWIGNNQFLRWSDNLAGRWPILGLDSGNNFRISAPSGKLIAIGPNLADVLAIGANYIQLNAGPRVLSGTGSPNSAVTGSVGDLFLRTDGGAGTTLYVKESGTSTNTGWVGK